MPSSVSPPSPPGPPFRKCVVGAGGWMGGWSVCWRMGRSEKKRSVLGRERGNKKIIMRVSRWCAAQVDRNFNVEVFRSAICRVRKLWSCCPAPRGWWVLWNCCTGRKPVARHALSYETNTIVRWRSRNSIFNLEYRTISCVDFLSSWLVLMSLRYLCIPPHHAPDSGSSTMSVTRGGGNRKKNFLGGS